MSTDSPRSESAATKTARAVELYLSECSNAERWPDAQRVNEIFRENFAPIVAYSSLTTELTETKAKLSSVHANLAHADEKIGELQQFIVDQTAANTAKLAESERRMTQEHFEKMYALQDRLEKAEKETTELRSTIGGLQFSLAGSQNANARNCESLIRVVAERDAANTRALEAEVQVERMRGALSVQVTRWLQRGCNCDPNRRGTACHRCASLHEIGELLSSPAYAAMQSGKEGK